MSRKTHSAPTEIGILRFFSRKFFRRSKFAAKKCKIIGFSTSERSKSEKSGTPGPRRGPGVPEKNWGSPKKSALFFWGTPIFFRGPPTGILVIFFWGPQKKSGRASRDRRRVSRPRSRVARATRVRRGASPFGASHGIAHSARCSRTMVVLRTTDGAARRGRGGGGMAACLYEGAPAARRPARVARRR